MIHLFAYGEHEERADEQHVSFKVDDELAVRRKIEGWYKALETHTREGNDVALYNHQLLSIIALEKKCGVEGLTELAKKLKSIPNDHSVVLIRHDCGECSMVIRVGEGERPVEWADIQGLPSLRDFTRCVFPMDWRLGGDLVLSYVLENVVTRAITHMRPDVMVPARETMWFEATLFSKRIVIAVGMGASHHLDLEEYNKGQLYCFVHQGAQIVVVLS